MALFLIQWWNIIFIFSCSEIIFDVFRFIGTGISTCHDRCHENLLKLVFYILLHICFLIKYTVQSLSHNFPTVNEWIDAHFSLVDA